MAGAGGEEPLAPESAPPSGGVSNAPPGRWGYGIALVALALAGWLAFGPGSGDGRKDARPQTPHPEAQLVAGAPPPSSGTRKEPAGVVPGRITRDAPSGATPSPPEAPPLLASAPGNADSVASTAVAKVERKRRRRDGDKLLFDEVWAYLMPGEESAWDDRQPLSDLCLFDFSLDANAELKGKANDRAIQRAAARGIRTHLVVAAAGNASLLHLALSPKYDARKALLEAISALPRKHPAQGVQLDFEGVGSADWDAFLSFARELRAKLPPGVLFSLAIPARTRDTGRAFAYGDLAGAADRLFLMAYDQHWSGGDPGPIADGAWQAKVLAFAAVKLPRERVVVGLPFYGRVWQIEDIARAVKHQRAEELAKAKKAEVSVDPARGATFRFKTEVTAECWFETASSLRAKLEKAWEARFPNVGFWRLGQEDPEVWGTLGLEE